MMSVSRLLTALAAALAITLATGGVAAAETEATAAEKAQLDARMFGTEPAAKGNTYACFVRRYDADHLTRHPHQKVTSMKVLVTSEWFEENKSLERHFRLGITFRNKRGTYDSSGSCSHFHPEEAPAETRLGCGVDCDGGGLNIAMGRDDKSVMVRLERIRIWQNNKADESAGGELTSGKDDAIFRLDRADTDECASLITDRKELAAMRDISQRK